MGSAMKDGYCEFCPAIGDDCGVCAAYSRRDDGDYEFEAMRWADDGGRVIDHDADTTPAETLPETAALTRIDLDDADERADWVVFALLAVGSTLWVAAGVFALGRHAKWW
jgi:hypothetical protein